MESPQVIAARWASNLGASSARFTAGVNAVTENPMAKAAAKSDKYIQGVQRAVQTGKFQAGLNRGTLESWKQSMIRKGAPRLGTGASEAIPKMAQFLTEFLPALESARARVQSMPNDTRDQRMQRSMEMQRLLGEWGDRRRGGM